MDIERGLVKTRLGYIHYRVAGSGPPVMLFHINQHSSALMRELMLALAPHFRAVAMDYPSHGHSDPIDFQPGFDDYTDCAVAVMDALGIRTAAMMGEAVGAGVSVCMANRFPDRVGKVVLINCPFSPDRGRTAQHVRELQSGLRPEDETGFPLTRTVRFLLEKDPGHAPMHPTQDWMDRVNTAQMEVGRNRWQAVTALANFDMDRGLSTLSQPVMIILGEFFYYARFLDEMAKRVKDLRHATLPDGRFCMSWERATEIAERARPFLQA
ncbi:MAG: alpha/beta fold hydrolase [Acetobacteraceae bacterium]